MNIFIKIYLIVLLLFASFGPVYAVEMVDALDSVAEYFVKTAVRIDSGQELHILKVVNAANQSYDRVGKKIETELYFALERQFPDFKLFLGKGPNPEREIYLSGSYQQKGDKTLVKFRIFKGNEILAQRATEFDSKAHKATLVAVLDIDSEALSPIQIKAYSDIFRTELASFNAFTIASSADVDKMNPDAIQEATGCTRDECATIIGEQLGVDRTISISVFKLSEEDFVLSAKMFDLKDGSILVSKTVEHSGPVGKITKSIRKLAGELVGKEKKIDLARVPEVELPKIEPQEQLVPKEDPVVSSGSGSSFIWHALAITLMVGSAVTSVSTASEYNDLVDTNENLIVSYQEATSTTERDEIESEYDSNRDTMDSKKSTVATMDGLTAIAVLWEAYLLLFGGSDDGNATYQKQNENNFHWAVIPKKSGSRFMMNYKF